MNESESEDLSRLVERGAESFARRRELAAQRLQEARALYTDDEGRPILRHSFVVYLDALGTKRDVEALTDDRLREQIQLLDRFRWFLHDDDWESNLQRFMSFSDHVILGMPVNERHHGGQGLGGFLASIDGYQLNMAAHGRFLRGAVTAGSLYMDDRFVTGKGLVDAVVLEEQVATFPRVVLSDSCVELMLGDLDDCGHPFYQCRSPWNSQLLVDADGATFVNYLPAIDDLPDGPERLAMISTGLTAHKVAIEAKLTEFVEPGRIREKYRWAADYHNFVCGEFFSRVDGDFTITTALTATERRFPRLFRRLVQECAPPGDAVDW